MKKSLIIILATALCCVSCMRKLIYMDRFSYVGEYFQASQSPQFEYVIEGNSLTLTCKIWSGPEVGYIQYANPEKFDYFKELCAKYGDTGYNRTTDDQTYAYPASCANTIVCIDITSANDWDEQHPAGSLLNDLFDIEYRSFAKYIESGYDDSLFTNNNDDDQAAATRKRLTHLEIDNYYKMTTTRKLLSRLMDNDLRLIVASYYTPSPEYPLLITECLPVIDMQQTLTITLYLDDGTTRTGYVETVFE